MPQRVMILATDGFEQSELEGPKERLDKAGYETVVVSLEDGEITGWDDKDWGSPVTVDLTLAEAEAVDFDALVLPGGQMNPDILRLEPKVPLIIRDFIEQDKPVAAICHAPWLLIEAKVVAGKRVTSWPSVRLDLENAGADYVTCPVSIDGNLITSRKPDDIPAFSDAIIDALRQRLEVVEAA